MQVDPSSQRIILREDDFRFGVINSFTRVMIEFVKGVHNGLTIFVINSSKKDEVISKKRW